MPLFEFVASEYSDAGGNTIRIDDYQPTDHRHLFCAMYVQVVDDECFELQLHNAPLNWEVREMIECDDGDVLLLPTGPVLSIRLQPRHNGWVREFAKAFRRIVGRGQRYDDPNWKWICKRTADSLDRFTNTLWMYRHAKRHGDLMTVTRTTGGLFPG